MNKLGLQGSIVGLLIIGVLSVVGCSSDGSEPETSVENEPENTDSQLPDSSAAPQTDASGVGPPPASLVSRLTLDTSHYTQYLDADGIPIVASAEVNSYALPEARWIVKSMLQNRPDVINAIAATNTRLAIMAVSEFTTDIPEHSDLVPADYWDRRARGLGATVQRPAVSAGEESILQLPGDPYDTESILVHEFAHVVHQRGMSNLDSKFNAALDAVYQQAINEGLWENTYAASNSAEYFAEGVQSWFGTNRQNDSEHNDIDTREELMSYDPRLATLLIDIFGDNQWQYVGPNDRQTDLEHMTGFDRQGAGRFDWPDRLVDVDISAGPGVDASLPELVNVLSEDWSSIASPNQPSTESLLTFTNQTTGAVVVNWVNFEGQRIENLSLSSGESGSINTFAGHLFEVMAEPEQVVIARFRVEAGPHLAIIE